MNFFRGDEVRKDWPAGTYVFFKPKGHIRGAGMFGIVKGHMYINVLIVKDCFSDNEYFVSVFRCEKVDIKIKVYTYPTKHKEGFIQAEVDFLLKDFHGIDMRKFKDALVGTTCMQKNGDTIIFHRDIYNALMCGIEKRNLRAYEWD